MAEDRQTESSGISSEQLIEAVCDFIQGIGGTIINIRRYPTGSSIITMAIDRCMTALEVVFKEKYSFTISENDRILLLDSEPFRDKIQQRAYMTSFLESITARGIRSLTFKKTLSKDEIIEFVQLLSEKPDVLRQRGKLEDQLKEANVTSIGLDEKVFVTLSKDQGIADKNELEKLSKLDPGKLPAEGVRSGLLVQSLVSKLPLDKMNLSPEKLEEFKKDVDYEKLKDAQNLDPDAAGAMIAKAMEKMADLDSFDEESAARNVDEVTKEEEEVDERVAQIADTFKDMSKTILDFKQPEIRAKLLGDMMGIITNFKSAALSRILTAQMGEESDLSVKDQILRQITMKKKSTIVDMLFKKYHRLAEGLNTRDFELHTDEITEGEFVLKKLLKQAKAVEDRELSERVRKALGIARMVSQEGKSPQALLVLKLKRIFAKGPRHFIKDELINNFPDLTKRLMEVGRADVVRNVIDKMASNFNNEDTEIRLQTVEAFVRICQDLIEMDRPEMLNEAYGRLVKQLRRETDQAIFTRILATLASDYEKVLNLRDYMLALNILKAIRRYKDECTDETRKQLLQAAVDKLSSDQDILIRLLESFKTEGERNTQSISKLLKQFPNDKVLRYTFVMLKENDDMSIRKKCIKFLGGYGMEAVEALLNQIQPENPWYYNRNIINLLGDAADAGVATRLLPYLKDKDERVRKATISALAKFGDEATEQALTEQFDDQPEGIQKMLLQHFGQVKSKPAVDKLISILEKPGAFRRDDDFVVSIIQALGRIGDAKAATVISAQLKKSGGIRGLFQKTSDAVIEASIGALGRIGDASYADLVKKYIKHENPDISRTAKDSFDRLSEAAS